MSLPIDSSLHFHKLGPDSILDAVESIGFRCDGHVSALNSYENRVYQIGIEDGTYLIAKFYRPQRWTDAGINEEHVFTAELAELEIPVISPIKDKQDNTLFQPDLYRFALYPRVGGRAPELDDADHLMQLGRCLARVHNVGSTHSFQHRPTINIETYASNPRQFLLENDFIPSDLCASYETLTEYIIQALTSCYDRTGELTYIRLHGDCHLGNILWNDHGPFLVDFDDARMGPAIQDLWMLLSGDRPYMTARLHELLEGYCDFKNFDPRELQLIEPLRTMRMMHHAGWLARRWDDPAFPMAFPWFNSQRFWEEHILHLKEQLAMLDEPPLEWQR